jgi:hypothetical protein
MKEYSNFICNEKGCKHTEKDLYCAIGTKKCKNLKCENLKCINSICKDSCDNNACLSKSCFERKSKCVGYKTCINKECKSLQCSYMKNLMKKYKTNYGEGCMINFIESITQESEENKDLIIMAYNGASFDYYFLLNELIKRGVTVSNLLVQNTKLLGFSFGNNCKIFDLYLFISSSLDSACKSYDIVMKKTSFNHNLIHSYIDAEIYRGDVEPYLITDVLALREIFIKFNTMIYKTFQVNITKYITLSNLGYCIFTSNLKYPVEIVSTMEKYDYIKASTYGARCYPSEKKFTSIHADDIESGKMSYEELKQTDEYIFNADCTSLYPSAMSTHTSLFKETVGIFQLEKVDGLMMDLKNLIVVKLVCILSLLNVIVL